MTTTEYKQKVDTVFEILKSWHGQNLTIFDLEEDDNNDDLSLILKKLAHCNYLGWHYCEIYFENLRNKNFNGLLITETNKSRNVQMEKIDEFFEHLQSDQGEYHTESFGSITDRLINDYIKYLHCVEYDDDRSKGLFEQINLLIEVSSKLLDDVLQGKKKLLVWKKFKVKYE